MSVFLSFDEGSGVWYYFNFQTGEAKWEHPLGKLKSINKK